MRLETKEILRRAGTRPVLITLVLIASGSLLLLFLDGWVGIVVWAVSVPVLCILLDLALRPVRRRNPEAREQAFLLLERGPRPARRRLKRRPPERFVWHDSSRPRPRSR